MEKLGKSKKCKKMHYSVGALIKKNNKYLLIDRNIKPYGFACVAGHIDKNESIKKALKREVKEESGLNIVKSKLILKGELEDNYCSKGVSVHSWYIFDCKTRGKIKINKESKSIGWYSKKEIKKLKLEFAWKHWFKKLNII